MLITFLFLDAFLPFCDDRFAIDCSSHVRLYLESHIAAIFRNNVLIDDASIAIWNRNKVAVILAITVWVITVAFHLQSKFLPLTPSAEDPESQTNMIWYRYHSSEWPISIIFDELGLFHP